VRGRARLATTPPFRAEGPRSRRTTLNGIDRAGVLAERNSGLAGKPCDGGLLGAAIIFELPDDDSGIVFALATDDEEGPGDTADWLLPLELEWWLFRVASVTGVDFALSAMGRAGSLCVEVDGIGADMRLARKPASAVRLSLGGPDEARRLFGPLGGDN
jgi:hypothetical protein